MSLKERGRMEEWPCNNKGTAKGTVKCVHISYLKLVLRDA
jgi:hypothetical protein